MPTRGRTRCIAVSILRGISIHVPTRGTTLILAIFAILLNFNPRAHEGHDCDIWKLDVSTYFNPRAHEGHDDKHIETILTNEFQSTCPRGARQQNENAVRTAYISIHVPTRGTTPRMSASSKIQYFNPRAHEGHDVFFASQYIYSLFQSTCPRGARLYHALGFHNADISIHVPTRGTTPGGTFVSVGNISIHVPTRGTTVGFGMPILSAVFQSTCPRGARRIRCNLDCEVAISIHVPTRGTTVGFGMPMLSAVFQSTCPRGARPGSLRRQ